MKISSFDLHNHYKIKKKTFVKQSILIHLAWDFLPDYDSTLHIQKNTINSYNFIMKNINAGIKNILVAGTCFEYGLVNGPIKSNTICNPTNMYAIGKNLLHKMLLLEKKKLSYNLLWTRIFYPYGENQKSGIIAQLEKAINKGDKYFNMSSGNQKKDFVEVNEVARQIIELINFKSNGSYNICSGKPTKVIDLVKNWKKINKSDIKFNRNFLTLVKNEPKNFWGVK